MKPNNAELRASLADAASIPDAQSELAASLRLIMDCIPAISLDPQAAPEVKEATRWLYEQIINYRGMLRKRPLTNSIEFLTPARDMGNPGWYYKVTLKGEALERQVALGVKLLKSHHQPAFNWKGPFASHSAALAARDEHLPRTQFALLEAEILALAD